MSIYSENDHHDPRYVQPLWIVPKYLSEKRAKQMDRWIVPIFVRIYTLYTGRNIVKYIVHPKYRRSIGVGSTIQPLWIVWPVFRGFRKSLTLVNFFDPTIQPFPYNKK